MRGRRVIMLRVIGLVIISLLMGSLCNPLHAAAKYKDYPVPKACVDQVRAEGAKLYVYNWAEWWPEELFKNFSKEFGVKVVFDYYSDTEEMVAKFKLNPKTPYDVVLGCGPASVLKLMRMDAVQKINHDWLPNVKAYLKDEYKGRDFDPNNDYQIPDSGYVTTYVYNSKYVDHKLPGFGSWKWLFETTEYAGKITMQDNMYEVVGAALKALGYSWNSDIESELMEAKDLIMKQKNRVQAYDSWPRRPLVEEEAWISQSWDGDGWLVSRDVKTLKSVLPSEGTLLSANNGFIPIGSKHKATAHLFFNYIFRPEVNALLIKTIGYAPSHKHTMEFMPAEMRSWPGFNLSEEYIKKCDSMEEKQFTGKGKELRVKIWEELKK